MLSEPEWAWLAGLFEGEGCIHEVHKRQNRYRFRIQITSTDQDIIERVQELTGVGYIHEQKKQKAHYKQIYVWYVAAKTEVRFILKGIRPWLGIRRGQKADEALERFGEKRHVV